MVKVHTKLEGQGGSQSFALPQVLVGPSVPAADWMLHEQLQMTRSGPVGGKLVPQAANSPMELHVTASTIPIFFMTVHPFLIGAVG
jgi:hypothetical protein